MDFLIFFLSVCLTFTTLPFNRTFYEVLHRAHFVALFYEVSDENSFFLLVDSLTPLLESR